MYAAFKEAKAKEIEVLLRRQKCGTLLPKQLKRPDFRAALQKKSVSIIAEFKQASPSLGVIRSDLMVEDCARIYEEHGAAAMSILTEERFFQGSISFLERAAKVCGLALLRKDFL
ncbi:MAG: indole-3-glycerol-phosphate synthase, partial [Desulfovibrio sp.]|nr:indole-3-glycerol-phosphate synthase [Desulfovibrio sp.]